MIILAVVAVIGEVALVRGGGSEKMSAARKREGDLGTGGKVEPCIKE